MRMAMARPKKTPPSTNRNKDKLFHTIANMTLRPHIVRDPPPGKPCGLSHAFPAHWLGTGPKLSPTSLRKTPPGVKGDVSRIPV